MGGHALPKYKVSVQVLPGGTPWTGISPFFMRYADDVKLRPAFMAGLFVVPSLLPCSQELSPKFY